LTETGAGEGRRYDELVAVVRREIGLLGGYGEVTLCIKAHAGQPRAVEVLSRKQHYLLGGGAHLTSAEEAPTV
jgi:hypothetical protein